MIIKWLDGALSEFHETKIGLQRVTAVDCHGEKASGEIFIFFSTPDIIVFTTRDKELIEGSYVINLASKEVILVPSSREAEYQVSPSFGTYKIICGNIE